MSQLTDYLCERIRCGDGEAFLGAHEVLLEFRLKTQTGGGIEPWASRILAEPPSAKDVKRLRAALLDALLNGNDSSASDAAFALAELQDAELVPVLRKQLHRQMRALSRTYGAVWNLIQALECSGEEVLPAARSRSALDIEAALRGAREYLAKHRIMVTVL